MYTRRATLLLPPLSLLSPLPLLSAVFDSLNEGYLKAMVERAYVGSSGGGAGVAKTEEQKGGEDEGGDDGRSSSPRFRMLSFGIGSGRSKPSASAESASAKASAASPASSANASASGDPKALEPPSHACSALLACRLCAEKAGARTAHGSYCKSESRQVR